MPRRLSALIILAAAVALALSTTPASAQSIGLVPGSIDLTEALRGGEYRENFRIINQRPEQQVYEIAVSGEAAPWITVYDAQNRTVPVSRITSEPVLGAELVVRVAVPADAPNRLHVAEIKLNQIIEGEEGEGQVIESGLALDVNVDVTGTQRLVGNVFLSRVRDTEVGLPLHARLGVQNSGNVAAEPFVQVTIMDASGNPIGDVTKEHDVIPLGESATLSTDWDTTGHEVGDYTAQVVLRFSEQEIFNETFPFHLWPPGTFTRQGEFQSLTVETHSNPGGIAKLVAVFHNTGEIDTLASFSGEVRRGDEIIATAESDELLVEPDLNAELEIFVSTEERAKYTVQGRVLFEGKETAEKAVTFKVPPDLGSGGLFGLPWWQVAIGGVAIAAVTAVLLDQTRKRWRTWSDEAPP